MAAPERTTVLITGSGMLAAALATEAPRHGYAPVVAGKETLDVTDGLQVASQVAATNPAIIFHTAALTRVNYCEEHPEQAFAVNAGGTANVLAAAQENGAQLVYFSTDYVFDGNKGAPYVESDEPVPLNAYGASKLKGEELLKAAGFGSIIRTSGVFGANSNHSERNFFRAIREKLVASDAAVPVVVDQETAITYAAHLAAMAISLLATGLPPVLHLTSSGADSWFGWARRWAQVLKMEPERIVPVAAAGLGSRLRRPTLSVLDSEVQAARLEMERFIADDGLKAYSREMDDSAASY